MKLKLLSILTAIMLLLSASALATSLPGLDALTALAKSSSPTPLSLPAEFSITYRTQAGELSLSRSADGNLTYVNGAETALFLKSGDDAYLAATPTESGYTLNELTPITFEQVKERIAPVWQLIAPVELGGAAAVTASFDGNTEVLGRSANRFRLAVHTGTEAGYSVTVNSAVWITLDHENGICLMKETAADENHANATVEFECVSLEIR